VLETRLQALYILLQMENSAYERYMWGAAEIYLIETAALTCTKFFE